MSVTERADVVVAEESRADAADTVSSGIDSFVSRTLSAGCD